MRDRVTKVRVDAVTLRVREWGEGPPILFAHGLGMSADLWVHQVEAFAPSYRMIAVDLRGFGQSDRPTETGAYAIERFADDLYGLARELDLEELTFLGTSMGGFIGQVLALAHPEILKTLVLCHTSSRMSIPPDILEARVRALREAPMEDYGRMVAEQAVAPEAPPELRAWVAAMVVANDREAYTRVLIEGLAAFDATADVGKIAVPTLVVVGEHDRIIPPDGGRDLARAIAGAELVEIPGVGHLGYAEKPAAFNRAVLKFLRASKNRHGNLDRRK